MSIDLRFEGGREMERQLAQLKRATARAAARRAIRKTLEPVRAGAAARSTRFAYAIGARLHKAERRRARSDFVSNVVTQYVGPTHADGGHAPLAPIFEFGTGPRFQEDGRFVGAIAPEPALRPAWDAEKPRMLERLGALMWEEIQRTLARAAARGG